MKCARHVHGTFISRHLGVEWVVYAGNRLFHRAVCSRHMFCQMHLFICSYKCIMMLTNAINRLQIDLSRRWIDDWSMPQRWISVDSTPLQRWVPLLTRCDIIWDEAFLKWNWALFLTLLFKCTGFIMCNNWSTFENDARQVIGLLSAVATASVQRCIGYLLCIIFHKHDYVEFTVIISWSIHDGELWCILLFACIYSFLLSLLHFDSWLSNGSVSYGHGELD